MLVVVLVICLGLVSITLVFGHSMLMAYRGEDNDLAARQAQNAIEGAVHYTETLLTKVTTAGALPDPTLYQKEAVPVGEATFWFIGEPPTNGQVSPSNGPGTGGINGATDQPVFGLVDEASKLNLNRATRSMLLLLPNMTEELADAIVAWRTQPGTGGGSATGGNATAIINNSIKNAPFESVEELALVNGGTDLGVLYGNDTNLNHCLDAEEQIGGLAQLAPGLLEYVTVFSREFNTLSDGTTKRVNVTNPSNSTSLNTLLTEALGAARAGAILGHFRGSGGRPGSGPTQVRVGSVLEFYKVAQDVTSDEMDKIGDRLTVTAGAYTTGMINVNTASATVLGCVPGLDDNKAAQVVAARQAQTVPVTNFSWVLPIVGDTNSVKAAGPYLTTHSYQVSADIAAVGRHGRGYRRTRVVVDNSSGTPQVVYRRDLSSLGWALGSGVRQNLAKIVGATNNTGGLR